MNYEQIKNEFKNKDIHSIKFYNDARRIITEIVFNLNDFLIDTFFNKGMLEFKKSIEDIEISDIEDRNLLKLKSLFVFIDKFDIEQMIL
jgi:hypothetical protein